MKLTVPLDKIPRIKPLLNLVSRRLKSTFSSSDPIYYIDGVMMAIFALLVGLLPLIFTMFTSEEFEFPKLIFVYACTLLLILLAVCRAVLSQQIPLVHTPLRWPILAFVGVYIIGTIFSIDRYTSLTGFRGYYNGGLLSLLCYVIMFYLYLSHPGRLRYQRFLVGCWLAGAFLASLWAIFQYFGYDLGCLVISKSLTAKCWNLDFQWRAGGSLGHPNYLAAYMLAGLPLAWASMLRASAAWQRVAGLWIGLLMYAALWFTYSRAGLIGLVVALFVLGCAVTVHEVKRRRLLIGTYVIGCILISAIFWQANASRWSANETSFTQPASSFQTRKLVWQSALQVIIHHPLVGTGPETFAYSYQPYRPAALNQTIEWATVYTRAHNELLNLAATIGVPGLLSFLAIIICAIWFCWRHFTWPVFGHTQGSPRHTKSLLGPALLASILATFTAQIFGFAVIATSVLLWLSLAMIVSWEIDIKEVSIKSSTHQLAFIIVTIVPLVLTAYAAQSYVRADIAYTVPSWRDTNLTEAIKQYKEAITLNPFEATYYASLAKASALQAHQTAAGPTKVQLVIQADQDAQIAYALSPHNPIILEGLTTVYDQLGEITKAYYASSQEMAEHEIALTPTDSRYRQNLARADVALGQTSQARVQLQKMASLRPVADNYWKLSQFEHQYGTKEQYQQAVEKTLQIDPHYKDALAAKNDFEP